MKANARITNSPTSARKPSNQSKIKKDRPPTDKKQGNVSRYSCIEETKNDSEYVHTGVSRIYGEWILLCAGLCISFLLLLTSGDYIRTFSESEGIGALSSSLRTWMEENDSVASFFGLDTPSHSNPDEISANEASSNSNIDYSVPVFSFTDGMGSQEYIELHNAQNYKTSGEIPVIGTVTSTYSFRKNPFYGIYDDEDEYEFHTGIDIAAEHGTEILCYLDGVVESCGLSANYGYYICVDHGNGLKTLYAHASELLCFEGDEVKRGQSIALVGDTGRATGAHLHFEVYEKDETDDPKKYLSALFEKNKDV